ncbi:MAG TPA: sulfurtransferase TusA family protein [Candidatus Limnocylindrales bacterium]|nr:sulfurtransferase TusA family protein [Candidatus Limnocylindrales bacterium]
MELTQIDKTLDARGLACPMPIVKTAQMMKTMVSGQTLEVISTDAGSVKDFAAWSRTTGNPLLESSSDAAVFRFVLRKA